MNPKFVNQKQLRDLIMNGIKRNIVNEKAIIESLISFKRAGANAIVTYFADRILKYL